MDLRLLNIEELIALADWLESPNKVESRLVDARGKKPHVEYIHNICPKITNSGRLPVPALEKLCGVLYEHANKE